MKKLAQCDGVDTPSNAEKSSKKRARSEELLEALATIRQSQQEQTELISSLLHDGRPKRMSIEESLNYLISHYDNEDDDQRPCKIGGEFSDNSCSEDVSSKIEDDFVGDHSYLNWFAV